MRKQPLIFYILLLNSFLLMLSRVQADSPEVHLDKNIYFAYRSFWPEHETMKKFRDCGVHTICLFPSSTTNSFGEPYSKYPPVWRYFNSYDWASLDRQFDEIIAFNPKAEFLCMIDLNTPAWLVRHLSGQGDGNFDSFSDLSNCLVSQNWKTSTMKYLKDFLAHTEDRYGNRIKAYILACGQTDEWMDYGMGRLSRAKQAALKKWSVERKIPLSTGLIDFQRLDHASFENLIRDPVREKEVISYIAFHQNLVANTIIEFAKKTKELTSFKKEVGVFFGYILELTHWRMVECGHMEYEKVFASEYLDFFISPGTYTAREMGQGSGFMSPNVTRLLYHKGFIHEVDHRTTTYNCHMNEWVSIGWMNAWKSQEEDIAGMRRELALALINHSSIWFFDMWGGAHQTEKAIKNIQTMKCIWDRFVNDRSGTVAQVLLVVDPQSASQINDRTPQSRVMYNGVRNRLNKLGAPYDICSFNDLDKMNLDQYKFLIFPGSFLITPDRQQVLKNIVFKQGRTILWCYAPGINDGKTLDVKRVEQLTGTPFKTPGIKVVNQESWNSVYVYDYALITEKLLKELAVQAGVTLYCEEEVSVYANSRLCAVHVAQGGVKTVTLPKKYRSVVELFSGKEVATDTNRFSYSFNSPETALFELRD